MQLNASQRKAVQHVNGPLLVLAGPGSGKTRVITERTKYLIEEKKISPSSILVVSFSRASAMEMKERFLEEIQESTTKVHFSTFHSLFFKILRENNLVNKDDVISEKEKYSILMQWKQRFYKDAAPNTILDTGMRDEDVGKYLDEIERFSNQRVSIEDYVPEYVTKNEAKSMILFYDKVKQYNHKIDFHDMEVKCLKWLLDHTEYRKKIQNQYSFIMVDEFQDINKIQFEIINLMLGKSFNLVAVGDEDQSIYEFRGASPQIMLDFQNYYPKSSFLNLEQNYRSGFSILALSQRLIQHNQMRYPKKLLGQKSKKDGGVHIHKVEDDNHQAKWLISKMNQKLENGEDLSKEAVLFRNHACGGFLAGQFYEHGIPFSLKGYLPDVYLHFIGRDILAYFNVATTWQGGWNKRDFLRIMNKPLRYISHGIFSEASPSWEEIMNYYIEDKKDWMCQRMDEFRGDLKHLSYLSPYAGIMYIRKIMGYEDYVVQLAGQDLDKKEQWLDILNEISMFAQAYSTKEAWYDGIKGYRDKLEHHPIQENGIQLMTIHASKGLEFEQVYLIDVVEGIIPYKKAVSQGKIEEERRLFYVALTRAKYQIDLFVPKKRNSHQVEISDFISELKDD